jgi:hypothetical protein
VAEIGAQVEVTHLYDVKEYARRGVLLTPALAIDGDVVIEGRIPEVEELKDLLAQRGAVGS